MDEWMNLDNDANQIVEVPKFSQREMENHSSNCIDVSKIHLKYLNAKVVFFL